MSKRIYLSRSNENPLFLQVQQQPKEMWEGRTKDGNIRPALDRLHVNVNVNIIVNVNVNVMCYLVCSVELHTWP